MARFFNRFVPEKQVEGKLMMRTPAAPYRNNKDLNAGEQATSGECNLTKFLERKKQVLIIC